MDAPGKGEAAAIALLSSPTGPAARAYAALAAGCSVRLSPMPYIAIADATLLEGAGLPPMQPDEMAIVQLFSEPPEAVPEAEQVVPRVVVRPILAPGSAAAEDGDIDEATEAAACRWALGNRLPLLVDFDEDPYWSKRAGTITFVKMHALLFLSPPHKDLAGVVRRAATRFERGALIIMQFMLADMNPSGNAMFKRYGVNSVLDTPRLVFLDQRLDKTSENRQRVYKSAITEEGVFEFLRDAGLEEAEDGQLAHSATKDEL